MPLLRTLFVILILLFLEDWSPHFNNSIVFFSTVLEFCKNEIFVFLNTQNFDLFSFFLSHSYERNLKSIVQLESDQLMYTFADFLMDTDLVGCAYVVAERHNIFCLRTIS